MTTTSTASICTVYLSIYIPVDRLSVDRSEYLPMHINILHDVHIYIYIYIQKITHYRPEFFGFPFRTVSKDFTRILYLPDVYTRIFCEAHKNPCLCSMEPIIQRMQTELKASAGNMTRARSAYRAKKRKPKSRNQRILVGGGGQKKK